MKYFLLLFCGVAAWAQLERPLVGVVVDQNRDARLLSGVAASATLGEPLLQGVVALACSSTACAAKTETALLSSTGDVVDARPGAALLSVNATGTYAYFLESAQLLRQRDGEWQSAEFPASRGDVLAIRATSEGIDYAVLRDSVLYLEHDSQILAILPVAERILLLDGAVLLAARKQVILLRTGEQDLTFHLPSVLDLIATSDGRAEIMTENGLWLLATASGELTQIPGARE